jgi:hypothetical protein
LLVAGLQLRLQTLKTVAKLKKVEQEVFVAEYLSVMNSVVMDCNE